MIKNLTELVDKITSFKGLASDSREVREGYVFVAVRGGTVDGHDFIPQALANGASVIVGEKDLKTEGADFVKVTDSRDALGILASEYYGNPSKKLKVIGVTGTKGKTTTAYLIDHVLSNLGKRVGLVSSIAARIGDKKVDTGFHVTSPDVISLHKLLKEMVDAGCQYAVIEVSSHGIDQKRIAGVSFDVGVLTNIAPEHLDYHKNFAEYKKVKMSFMNAAKIKVFSWKDTDINVLPGKFNNLDAQAAIDVALALGQNEKDAIATLSSFHLPEGRLEEIKTEEGFSVFIDFAHTSNSLEAALGYLRTVTDGKLIAVFGCAGERDRKKRFQMGKISVKLADISVFTAEDPRGESLPKILGKMAEGARSVGAEEGKNFVRIPERGEAIAYALNMATKGDVVGIFGKGHEKSMAFKGFEHPWSDQSTVRNFLDRNKNISAIVLAAGKGTRMKSAKPKVLHEICGRPMISYSLQNLRDSRVGEIVPVVSYRKNLVTAEIKGATKIAVQKNPKGGTANAVAAGLPLVSDEARDVMVLYGDDTAFYTPETIGKVLENHFDNRATLTFITLVKENPFGLGRIVRSNAGDLVGIVEEKDANDIERKIQEVNDGLYIFNKEWLRENLPKVQKSPVTGEYYLVELIKMAIDQGKKVIAYKLPGESEWQGINNPEELTRAEEKMKEKLENYHG